MQREKWLDILKFMGIWIVYFGHMNSTGGRLYNMAWNINVPLFFIVSGMCENFSQSRTFINYLKKNINSLLVPFYFFAFVSMIFFEICYGWNTETFKDEVTVFLLGGIRNKSISATTLWFISCLFSVRIIFYVIHKMKFKVLMIAGAALLYCNYGHINGICNPSLPFNIDSACGYLFYYVMGYTSYPLLNKCLLSKTLMGFFLKGILGTTAAIYTVCLYLGRNVFKIPILGDILYTCSPVAPVLGACIIVFLMSLFAYKLQDSVLFSNLGAETLYYCGLETILKRGTEFLLAIFGIKIECANAFQIIVYTFLLLFIGHKYIVPITKSVLNIFQTKITYALNVSEYCRNNNHFIFKVKHDE